MHVYLNAENRPTCVRGYSGVLSPALRSAVHITQCYLQSRTLLKVHFHPETSFFSPEYCLQVAFYGTKIDETNVTGDDCAHVLRIPGAN